MEQNTCEKRRKIRHPKRLLGLKKKTSELSILCGVDACMVFVGPNGEHETWPENRSEVIRIIERCKSHEKKEKRKAEDSYSILEAKKRNLEKKLFEIRRKNAIVSFLFEDESEFDKKMEMVEERSENESLLSNGWKAEGEELLIYNENPIFEDESESDKKMEMVKERSENESLLSNVWKAEGEELLIYNENPIFEDESQSDKKMEMVKERSENESLLSNVWKAEGEELLIHNENPIFFDFPTPCGPKFMDYPYSHPFLSLHGSCFS
ncbi:uncharacterized protein LOC143861615 [Tasmannia lanceolata]|uniref:uncharacterized protein LOC143861615 n=1 Tax=Tasmannia lanceolata TaxID=3420 RepID=UPI004064B411